MNFQNDHRCLEWRSPDSLENMLCTHYTTADTSLQYMPTQTNPTKFFRKSSIYAGCTLLMASKIRRISQKNSILSVHISDIVTLPKLPPKLSALKYNSRSHLLATGLPLYVRFTRVRLLQYLDKVYIASDPVFS